MVRTGNYEYGKIYKIVSNQTDDIYIGSTSQKLLFTRFAKHRAGYNTWLRDGQKFSTSWYILKYDDAQIILIENYPCKDKYELEARERHHIENNKCVNKQIPVGVCMPRNEYKYQWAHKNWEKVKEQKN